MEERKPSPTFLERCITIVYDKNYLHDIVHASYSLMLDALSKRELSETARSHEMQEVVNEYLRVLSRVPIFSEVQQRPLEHTPDRNLIGVWQERVLASYAKISDRASIDVLYDPRTVFDNLATYMARHNGEFKHLNTVLGLLRKHGKRHLTNHLPELSLEAQTSRIETWKQQFPKGLADHVSDGDLNDVAYLGSRAMAEAFCQYFAFHCLSGSLGLSAVDAGMLQDIATEDDVPVNHLFTLTRISQRVLGKHLLKKARDYRDGTANPSLWIDVVEELRQTKERMDAHPTLPKDVKPTIELIHTDLMNYVTALSSIDTSVLRHDLDHRTIPFVSQLDSVYLMRREQCDGSSGAAIFADEMGTGKTLSAILADALYRKDGAVRKTLIVCPNNMKDEWKERFYQYISDVALQSLYGVINADKTADRIKVINGSRSLKDIGEASVVIANYEMITRVSEFIEQDSNTIIGHAARAYENGLEELINQDDFIRAVKDHAKVRIHNGQAMSEARQEFKKHPEVLSWIGTDATRAAYALAAEAVLKDERKMTESLFSYGADNLILDEGHAIKNTSARRTKGVRELSLRIPRKCILTGTLLPNRHDDIHVPLQLVDKTYEPETVASDEPTSKLAPKLRKLRQALIPYLSRNLREEVDPRPYAITPESDRPRSVAPDKAMIVVYRAIIEEQSLNFGEKTRLTRLSTLNPVLALNKLAEMSSKGTTSGSVEDVINRVLNGLTQEEWQSFEDAIYIPPKFEETANIIREGNTSVVIFTSHIQGNTRPLENPMFPTTTLVDYLTSAFPDRKVLVHDGQTKKENGAGASERQQTLDTFNSSPGAILIASYGTLSQGTDLTTAPRIIALDIPYIVPEQAVGRVDRLTQTQDVQVRYLMVTDGALSHDTKSGLTIDQAVLRLGRDKIAVSNIVLDGKPPTEQELNAYRNLVQLGDKNPGEYTPISGALEIEDINAEQVDREKTLLKKFLAATKRSGRSSSDNIRDFDDHLRKVYIVHNALVYGSYTATSNRMITEVIKLFLDGKRLADVGGGPASLAICGGLLAPYTVIDPTAWKASLETTLGEHGMQLPPQVTFEQMYIKDYLAKGTSLDVAVLNNMLHWTGLTAGKGEFCERELLLRNVNKLLVPDGRLVIGMPGQYDAQAIENIETFLHHTGFGDHCIEPITAANEPGYKQLLVVARKTNNPSNSPIHKSSLLFKFSEGTDVKKGGARKAKRDVVEKFEPTQFVAGTTKLSEILEKLSDILK